MADINDPVSLNVQGVRELIGSKVNKINEGVSGDVEGASSDVIDELTLKLDDEELLALKGKWERKYAPYESKIRERQEANKKYYLGRQLEGTQYNVEFPIAANLLFEAEETFLPVALSQNPEPVVWADNTPEGTELSADVKTMLQYHADQLELRGHLTRMTRHWSIYFLGVMKHGWDKKTNDIRSEARNPQNFIFDPNASVDVFGNMDSYLGERITDLTASDLIDLFPKHKAYITATVKGELGTEVTYTEWWTDEYCFSTFKDIVLDKHKNEFFNYETEKITADPQTGEPTVEKVPGKNHFASPKKPYTFLSIFSLGEQPHDITGLIEQNIPNQNLITKRTMQIDVNLSRQNNSVAFSGDNFNQQTAKQASMAFEKGNPVLVPSGRPISEAIVRFPAESYPEGAFHELENNKQNLRASFGTQGLTAQQQTEDTTARGMILNQQRDSTRIGGGIGDAEERAAKGVFNFWVQLYYVFYDEEHIGAIMGSMKAAEFVKLSSASFDRKLVVSVAPGSMAPKDEVNERNQAIELFQMGVLDPKTLLTILNVPNIEETAENSILWALDKMAYLQINYPQLAQQIQASQQQQMAQQQAAGQQQMQQEQAQGEQKLGQKEAAHKQGLRHKEEVHSQKMSLSDATSVPGAEPPKPSLSQVPMPK